MRRFNGIKCILDKASFSLADDDPWLVFIGVSGLNEYESCCFLLSAEIKPSIFNVDSFAIAEQQNIAKQ